MLPIYNWRTERNYSGDRYITTLYKPLVLHVIYFLSFTALIKCIISNCQFIKYTYYFRSVTSDCPKTCHKQSIIFFSLKTFQYNLIYHLYISYWILKSCFYTFYWSYLPLICAKVPFLAKFSENNIFSP